MLVYQMWYISEEGDDNDAYKYCHLLRVDYVLVQCQALPMCHHTDFPDFFLGCVVIYLDNS